MRLFAFAVLADENIAPGVVAGLRARGCDAKSVVEAGLVSRPDAEVLAHAAGEQRVVVTHDPDFGRLVLARRPNFVGIVYVRPGHINPDVILAALDALNDTTDLVPPFLATVSRRPSGIKIRVRAVSR